MNLFFAVLQQLKKCFLFFGRNKIFAVLWMVQAATECECECLGVGVGAIVREIYFA